MQVVKCPKRLKDCVSHKALRVESASKSNLTDSDVWPVDLMS